MYNVCSYKKRKNKGTFFIVLIAVAVMLGGYFSFKGVLHNKNKKVVGESPITKQKHDAYDKKSTAEFKYDENALFSVTYHYSCGHKKTEEKKIPLSFIGKTLKELTDENPNFKFHDSTPEVLRADVIVNSQCDDHYIIKLSGDKIFVYYKKNPELIEREIKINLSHLYDEDIAILKGGIEVGSKTEMLEFLEDFSS